MKTRFRKEIFYFLPLIGAMLDLVCNKNRISKPNFYIYHVISSIIFYNSIWIILLMIYG
jgi:hypothetical protein